MQLQVYERFLMASFLFREGDLHTDFVHGCVFPTCATCIIACYFSLADGAKNCEDFARWGRRLAIHGYRISVEMNVKI